MFEPRLPWRRSSPALALPLLVACTGLAEVRAPLALASGPDPFAGQLTSSSGPDPAPAVVDERPDRSRWIPVAGRHALGLSSGWAWYEGDVELTDLGGGLDGESGQDDTDLEPIFGLAVKYNYFFDEHFALGLVVEARTFEPTPVQPLAATIFPDEYTSVHFLLSSRYYSSPLEILPRVKWFGGLDLGYVSGIELDAEVEYSPSLPRDSITLAGDEFFTLAAVGGISLWIGDWLGVDASFELGGFYEWALDPTRDVVTLNLPSGGGGTNPNDVRGDVFPGGWIAFAGLTFYL